MSLSEAQLDALKKTQLQQSATDHQGSSGFNKSRFIAWTISIAASFVLFVLVTNYIQLPKIITAAYADIKKDSSLDNGMQPSMQQWLDENHIAQVPQEYPVKMSKFCTLDQAITTHLRIAGISQGEINIFFYNGERPLYWRDRSGTMDNMNWKVIKVRDNLSMVVLYSYDMRIKSVQYILNEMLPGLNV